MTIFQQRRWLLVICLSCFDPDIPLRSISSLLARCRNHLGDLQKHRTTLGRFPSVIPTKCSALWAPICHGAQTQLFGREISEDLDQQKLKVFYFHLGVWQLG